ncbi:hypothetical protein L7F22_001666 [Adiantum nelumboides]|nr:hypothetical protein [Adiantum nelumboides]
MVALNGHLTPSIILKRSIRQGCPLAPLLFVIVADALGWLVQDSLNQGLIKGLPIFGNPKDLCLQQFADDTNAIIQNNPTSVDAFVNCLDVFCSASGSVINPHKTGVWSSSNSIPPSVTRAGCKPIPSGSIFRLLGIPMGFDVSLKDRWAWVLEKFKAKVACWKGYQSSLSSRLFVLNHFLLPSTIFYLSCWRPPQAHINQIISIASSFLWGGTGLDRKIAKVSFKIRTLPKHLGGLELLDIKNLACKLAAKWIVRSLGCNDYWALLLARNCHKFQLKDLKAWSGFSHVEIFLSRRRFIYKGSVLTKSMWTAWDFYRDLVKLKPGKEKSSGGSSKGCDSTSDYAEYEVAVLAK